LLPSHRGQPHRVQNGDPQQAVDRKAAAGCSSPKNKQRSPSMRTGVGMSKHTNPGTSGRPKVRSNFGTNFSLYCADSSCFRQLAACLRADVNGRIGQ
jgi:hypothetical protein